MSERCVFCDKELGGRWGLLFGPTFERQRMEVSVKMRVCLKCYRQLMAHGVGNVDTRDHEGEEK